MNPVTTTRISALSWGCSAGKAVAAPTPQASPMPVTVRRTPRRASSAGGARRRTRSRHQVRSKAAAVTAPTHPKVTPSGREFQTSAATTLTSRMCSDSAYGPPASSWRTAARCTSASACGACSATRATGSGDMALFAVFTVGCATSRDAGGEDRAFLRHGRVLVRHAACSLLAGSRRASYPEERSPEGTNLATTNLLLVEDDDLVRLALTRA